MMNDKFMKTKCKILYVYGIYKPCLQTLVRGIRNDLNHFENDSFCFKATSAEYHEGHPGLPIGSAWKIQMSFPPFTEDFKTLIGQML